VHVVTKATAKKGSYYKTELQRLYNQHTNFSPGYAHLTSITKETKVYFIF